MYIIFLCLCLSIKFFPKSLLKDNNNIWNDLIWFNSCDNYEWLTIKRKDEDVEGIHLSFSISRCWKFHFLSFNSPENTLEYKELYVVKRRGMSLCSLSGSEGNMEIWRSVSCISQMDYIWLEMYDVSKRNIPGWILLLRRKRERYTENNRNKRP